MKYGKRERVILFIFGYMFLVFVYHTYLERYSKEQAEHRIQQMLLSIKSYSKFISKEQKPVIYDLQNKGVLEDGYFHPALLSTNYITRVASRYYNEELRENNLREIIFRQASINPLNPKNRADDFESKLIERFNKSEISEYHEIRKIDGKEHLYYAIPFKKVTKECMKCHNTPQSAPSGLVKIYGMDSGFGYKIGEINAATSIITSLSTDKKDSNRYLLILSITTLILFIMAYIFVEKMIAHIKKTKMIEEYSQELETKVQERTAELEDSLKLIRQTQGRLVETEKMASLGGLVAGVAHEINTPIGVSVTAASHLEKKYSQFAKLYEQNKVTQDDFDNFMDVNKRSTEIILNNLERASNLISSFKSIAVDQSSNDIREINLKDYLNAIVTALHPKLKKTNHRVQIDSDDTVVSLAAGALSQIVTNLIDNAIMHAFEEEDSGLITIEAKIVNNILELTYTDNGKGMDKQTSKKFFDPFFTTKRSSGGSGLGAHLVYNLVTQSLGGEISIETEPNKGLEVKIIIPIKEKDNV